MIVSTNWLGAPICQLTRGKEYRNNGNDYSIVDLNCDIYSYWQPLEISWYNGNEILTKNTTTQTIKEPNELTHTDNNYNNYQQTVILPIMLHDAIHSNNLNNIYKCVIRDNLGQLTSCQLDHHDMEYMQSKLERKLKLEKFLFPEWAQCIF